MKTITFATGMHTLLFLSCLTPAQAQKMMNPSATTVMTTKKLSPKVAEAVTRFNGTITTDVASSLELE